MTTDNQFTGNTETKSIPFGIQLRTAREAMGLSIKEVADHLRLNEKIILMLEKERYPADLPVTFIRGYIRSYGKLLELPEAQIKKGLEPIKAKPMLYNQAKSTLQPLEPVTSSHYFMQFFTYLIVLTLFGLVGSWWYTHSNVPPVTVADSDTTGASLAITPNTMSEAPVPAAKGPALQMADNASNKSNLVPITSPSAEAKKNKALASKDDADIDDDDADDNEENDQNHQRNDNQQDDNQNQQNDNAD